MTGAKIAAILLVAALSACGSHRASAIQTRTGTETVTSSQDRKSVTVQTTEGTTSIGQSIDTSRLGVPVYPGAQADAHGGMSSTTDEGTSVLASFKTGDSFDKVEAFYKQRLPAGSERTKVATSGNSIATFQVGAGDANDQVTVEVASREPSETNIVVARVKKSTP
ncbi:MAG TPA: hypothetical protein VFE36_13265 [Candidatus Baltobacteraceae bacterium]|nr:hypothetical protein [Candidatus Baltobacteraceae bacterium]